MDASLPIKLVILLPLLLVELLQLIVQRRKLLNMVEISSHPLDNTGRNQQCVQSEASSRLLNTERFRKSRLQQTSAEGMRRDYIKNVNYSFPLWIHEVYLISLKDMKKGKVQTTSLTTTTTTTTGEGKKKCCTHLG